MPCSPDTTFFKYRPPARAERMRQSQSPTSAHGSSPRSAATGCPRAGRLPDWQPKRAYRPAHLPVEHRERIRHTTLERTFSRMGAGKGDQPARGRALVRLVGLGSAGSGQRALALDHTSVAGIRRLQTFAAPVASVPGGSSAAQFPGLSASSRQPPDRTD